MEREFDEGEGRTLERWMDEAQEMRGQERLVEGKREQSALIGFMPHSSPPHDSILATQECLMRCHLQMKQALNLPGPDRCNTLHLLCLLAPLILISGAAVA